MPMHRVSQSDVFAEPVEPLGLAISPDGAQVALAYMRGPQPCLAISDVGAAEPAREIALSCGRPGGLIWSPNGSLLAFYAAQRDTPAHHIYVADPRSGEVRDLTPGFGRVAFIPSWSPRSDWLAFSAYTPPVGMEWPQVFTVSLAGGLRQRTTGLMSIRPIVSPDGRTTVFMREDARRLWLLDFATGAARPLLTEGSYDLHYGCFAPDGSRVVVTQYCGGYMEKAAIVEMASGALTPVTPQVRELARCSWSASGRCISFVRDRWHVVLVSPDGETLGEAALGSGRVMAGFSTSPVWAAQADVLAAMDEQGNAWVGGVDRPFRQVTFFPEVRPLPCEPAEVSYPSGEVEVPALLFVPPGGSSGRAIVWVHGGPWATAWRDLTHGPKSRQYLEAMVGAGFAVLAPDYRGSSEHGEEWERVAPEQRGIIDVDDLAAGARYLVGRGLAQEHSVAVAGYSFGGYLTLMALARYPDTFACGVSLSGVLNPERLAGAFGLDVGSQIPEERLANQSPLFVADQIRVPLLILHAGQETMATEEEVRHIQEALTRRGRTCEVTICPDDVHGFPLHTEEACEALVAFCGRHVGSGA
jgi:dipeptidyl aminopeptidase/acylaminoacyl peptidase